MTAIRTLKSVIVSPRSLFFIAIVSMIMMCTACPSDQSDSGNSGSNIDPRFALHWEHQAVAISTRDEGNVPVELTSYNPDPSNFHPLGYQSDPSIINDNGVFKIWYSAVVPDSSGETQGIAYTQSADGLLWDDPKNPISWVNIVLTPTLPDGWDNLAIETPDVAINTDTGEYFLYYSGRYENQKFHIGLATSNDGLNWSKYPDPVLTALHDWEQPYAESGGVLEPAVIYDADESRFKMWYATMGMSDSVWGGRIGYATSTDGINWNRQPEPVFIPKPGAWDAEIVGHNDVIKDADGNYHLFYMGTAAVGTEGLYGIGHAFSYDGITWQRDPNNPIITRETDTWHSGMVGGPSAVIYNDKIYLYYFGAENDQIWSNVHFGLSIGTYQGDLVEPMLNRISK